MWQNTYMVHDVLKRWCIERHGIFLSTRSFINSNKHPSLRKPLSINHQICSAANIWERQNHHPWTLTIWSPRIDRLWPESFAVELLEKTWLHDATWLEKFKKLDVQRQRLKESTLGLKVVAIIITKVDAVIIHLGQVYTSLVLQSHVLGILSQRRLRDVGDQLGNKAVPAVSWGPSHCLNRWSQCPRLTLLASQANHDTKNAAVSVLRPAPCRSPTPPRQLPVSKWLP